MTDITTPAALKIPQAAADAARDALWDCLPDTYDPQDMAFLACYLEDYALPAAARGIVAAELRRIADIFEGQLPAWFMVFLRERINELD